MLLLLLLLLLFIKFLGLVFCAQSFTDRIEYDAKTEDTVIKTQACAKVPPYM